MEDGLLLGFVLALLVILAVMAVLAIPASLLVSLLFRAEKRRIEKEREEYEAYEKLGPTRFEKMSLLHPAGLSEVPADTLLRGAGPTEEGRPEELLRPAGNDKENRT
jgi:hypothetical protein